MGRIWRQAGTGFCFLAYGGLAVIASVTVLPLLLASSRDRGVRERRVRHFISWSFRALLRVLAALGVGRVRFDGAQRLAGLRGCLVVATHPMYLDMVALIGAMPDAGCVVKAALRSGGPYHWFVRAAGYIANEPGEAGVTKAVAAIRGGGVVVMFPSGTRTRQGEPLRFRRGAAHVALRSAAVIVPVAVDCAPLALGAGQSWHEVGERTWTLSIRVLAALPPEVFDVQPGAPESLAARRLTEQLRRTFAAVPE